MKARSNGSFRFDLFLEERQTLEDGLGPGRASGNVNIDRQDLIDTLDHAIDIVHTAAVGARPHGHDPLGFGHLLVKAKNDGCYLFKDGPGRNEQIRLTGRASQNFGPESPDVVSGRVGYHLLDKTTGQSEEHRPEAVLSRPVDDVVDPFQDQVFHRF
jgi:hypothetical protein